MDKSTKRSLIILYVIGAMQIAIVVLIITILL